jgi:radical SAM protein with 4Fe4S-binding SPASM domain
MVIDATTACMLRCPFCVHGLDASERERAGFKPSFISYDDYARVMRELGPYLMNMYFYNWGEPFLHKNVYDMIALAKQYGIHVTISSNMNAGDPEKIVESGLDELVCSLDGATQETYEMYRVGGNLQAALDRAKRIIEIKKERKVKTPHITWVYLVFAHNEHEVEIARKRSEEMGFDSFFVNVGYIWYKHPVVKRPSEEWIRKFSGNTDATVSSNERQRERRRSFLLKGDEACKWLYSAIVLDPAGAVYPCCCVWNPEQAFGNWKSNKCREIFHSEKYRQVRGYFKAVSKGETVKCSFCNSVTHTSEMLHCEMCNFFKGPSPEIYRLIGMDTVRRYVSSQGASLPKLVDMMLARIME